MIFIASLRILFVVLYTLMWSVPVILFSYFDPFSKWVARFVEFWAKGNLWVCGIKIRAQGLDRLDPSQAYLFMSNHQSQVDILALMAILAGFQLRWVSKREVRKLPVIGLCMQLTQQVLVDRENYTQAITVMRQVKRLLNRGISVVFFPEGTRSKDGHLLPFKPGGFAVAVETGVPVVPVTINGSRAIMPSGDWKVRSGRIDIVFSEPILLDPHLNKKAARELLLVKVREAIVAHYRPNTATPPPADSPLVVSPSTPENPSS